MYTSHIQLSNELAKTPQVSTTHMASRKNEPKNRIRP